MDGGDNDCTTVIYEICIHSRFEEVDDAMEQLAWHLSTFNGLIDQSIGFSTMVTVRELLINAVEHGNQHIEDRKIWLTVLSTPVYLEVSVRDEGPGIEAATWNAAEEERDILQKRQRGFLIIRQLGWHLEPDQPGVVARRGFSAKCEGRGK